MKRIALVMIGILSLGTIGCIGGCAEEVSHTESDRQHILDNGQTHTEQTTYRNADGTYTTEKSKTKTSN